MRVSTIAQSAFLLTALVFAGASYAAMTPQDCLQCHGPFEALQKKTENWTDEFGDKVQPHVYLDDKAANPHQGAKVPPNCTGCHEEHPLPPPGDYKPRSRRAFRCATAAITWKTSKSAATPAVTKNEPEDRYSMKDKI